MHLRALRHFSGWSLLSAHDHVVRYLVQDNSINFAALLLFVPRGSSQVADGQTALDMLKAERFDLLVLDLGLPKRSGMQVLSEIRSSPPESAVRDMPVVVNSAHVLDECRRRCLEAG